MHGSLRWTSITGNRKLITALPLVRNNNVVISLLMWVLLCLSHLWKLFFLLWDISRIRSVYGCIVSSACFEIDIRCWLQQISMYVSCGWFPGNWRRGECLFTESVKCHRWVKPITWSWSLLFMKSLVVLKSNFKLRMYRGRNHYVWVSLLILSLTNSLILLSLVYIYKESFANLIDIIFCQTIPLKLASLLKKISGQHLC